MPVRNQNWYDLQAGRRYPLDDRSTGLDDSGEFIRDSILVDCHIRFPETLGATAFVQAITVSPTLVTVLIGVTDGTDTTTIAAISQPKPITTSKNYEVTPLVAGVAGWVAFGAGVEEPFSGRYATPAQSLLLSRCARAYRALPIPTIGKKNLDTALSGIVNFAAVAPIVIEQKKLVIQDRLVNVLEFSLSNTFTSIAGNPLQYFLSDCGVRPESGTCPKPPIETINNVTPDCSGNINILAEGVTIYQFENCGGIGVDLPIGLTDVCEKPRYAPPRRPQDLCVISSSSSSSAPSSSSSSASAQPIPPETPATLPVCETFNADLASILTVRRGRFVSRTAPAPDTCQD